MSYEDNIIRIGLWTFLSAPLWLPLLGWWLPGAVAARIRRSCGMLALATFAFCCLNASDRNPLQWPAVFVFMACLSLYVATVFLTGVVAMRQRS